MGGALGGLATAPMINGGGGGLKEAAGRLDGMLRDEETAVERQLTQGAAELRRAQEQLRQAQEEVERVRGAQHALRERQTTLSAMRLQLHQLQRQAASVAPAPPRAPVHATHGSLSAAVAATGSCGTVALWHPACLKHGTPGMCPETSLRLKAVVAELEGMQKLHVGKLAVRMATAEVRDRHGRAEARMEE